MPRKILLVVCAALVAFLPLAFAAGEDANETILPKITYLEGTVSVNLSGSDWVAGEKGMNLNESASVKTAEDSYCDVAFDKEMKNIISIGPNSEVKIGKAFQQVNISKGRVFAELKNLKPGSTFEVVTPQAVAGARGTAWETIVGDTSKINVKEHTVFVNGHDKSGAEQTSDVAQGYSLVVDSSGWLGELTTLTQEDWDRMESWSSRIQRALQSASSKGKCQDLIDGAQGASSNLFGQVMDCEVGGSDESFAAAGSEGTVLIQSDAEQGITGGDITTSTFTDSPVPETPKPKIDFTKPPHP